MTPSAENAAGDPGGAPRLRVRWCRRISGAWSSLPRRAITRGGALTIATGTARLGTVVAAVVVARTLGRADLGRYAAAVAIGAIVVSAPGSGLPIMAIRDVAAGRRGRRFVVSSIRAELLLTTLTTGFAVVVSVLVVRPVSLAAELGLLAGVGNISLTQLNLAQGLALGLQRHRLVVVSQIAAGILLPVLTAVAVISGLGLAGAVATIAVSSLPCVFATFWALWPDICRAPDTLDTHHLLWRSRTFLGFAAVNGGYQRVDAVLLLAFSTAAVSGLYASAYRFLGPFDLLEAGFAQVLFPLLSSLGQTSASWDATRRRARRLYFLTTLPLVAVGLLAAPQILVAVFGGAFRPATPAARILLLSVIPGTLYWPDALAMMAAGFERVVLYLFVISTALDMVLVPILSSHLGAAGAAWAWVAAELSLWIGLSVARRGRIDRPQAVVPRP